MKYLTLSIENRREYLEKYQLMSPLEKSNMFNIILEYRIPDKFSTLYPELMEADYITFDRLIDQICKNSLDQELTLFLLIFFIENQLAQQLIYINLADLKKYITISSPTGKWKTHTYDLKARELRFSVPENVNIDEEGLRFILHRITGYLVVVRISFDLLEVPPVHFGKEIVEKGSIEDFNFEGLKS